MKMLDTMPTSGSFIAVWEYDGQIWSDTYQWQEGVLNRYYDSTEWVDENWSPEYGDEVIPSCATNFKFIVLGEKK